MFRCPLTSHHLFPMIQSQHRFRRRLDSIASQTQGCAISSLSLSLSHRTVFALNGCGPTDSLDLPLVWDGLARARIEAISAVASNWIAD